MSAEVSVGRRYGEMLLGAVATSLLVGLFGRMEVAWVWVGWVALVPWLAVLDRARTVRQVLVAGLIQSVAFTVVITGWFADALREYAQLLVVVGVLAGAAAVRADPAAAVPHGGAGAAPGAARWAPEGAFLRVGLMGALVLRGHGVGMAEAVRGHVGPRPLQLRLVAAGGGRGRGARAHGGADPGQRVRAGGGEGVRGDGAGSGRGRGRCARRRRCWWRWWWRSRGMAPSGTSR